MDNGVVELHVDFPRHDDGVVDGIGPVNARRNAGRKLDDTEYGAVVQGGANLAPGLVLSSCVIDGKRFRGPDDTSRPSRPAGRLVFGNLVDLDDRPPILIMSGDNPT